MSAPSLKNRISISIRGSEVRKAIEKFIIDNACFASQLSFHDKEQIFAVSVYKNTLPSQNLQKALFKEPTVNLEVRCNRREEFQRRFIWIKTSDLAGHFIGRMPTCLVEGSRDLSKVTSAKLLYLFLSYYEGEPLSIELSTKELIEFHRLADYLFEDADPLVGILWRETLKLLHALRAENFREDFLQDLFSSILNSFEAPSAELIELLCKELSKATAEEQGNFFNKLKKEDPITTYFRAHCYQHGIGVLKCQQTATACYEKAAMSGYTPAWYILGLLYEEGKGVAKSMETAWDFQLKATLLAKRPYKPALFILADLYEIATKLEDKEQKSKEIYHKLASQYYAPVLKNDIADLEIAAEQNYPPALYQLVEKHLVEPQFQDLGKARKYLERALEDDYLPGKEVIERIAISLPNGKLKDKLIEKAAQEGYSNAQYSQALKLIGESKNREAKSLLIQAAKQNHPGSIATLRDLNVLLETFTFYFKHETNTDFENFRKGYNELIEHLEKPHILNLQQEEEKFRFATITPFNPQENTPPPLEIELETNKQLREEIATHIILNKPFAEFLPEEEKAKLATLPLFEEGVPSVIKDIFKEQPTNEVFLLRKETERDWARIIEEIQKNPHQLIHIKIQSEGLDERIITIPNTLFPYPLPIRSRRVPINLEKTEEKILNAFLDYLYAQDRAFLLNRSELEELKTLAELFNVRKLVAMINKELNGNTDKFSEGQSPPENARKTLNKLMGNSELVQITAQGKSFRAHKALLPKYFHAATSYKSAAKQDLIVDLSDYVEENVLDRFLKLQYGLQETENFSWEENFQLFTFYYFTEGYREGGNESKRLLLALIDQIQPKKEKKFFHIVANMFLILESEELEKLDFIKDLPPAFISTMQYERALNYKIKGFFNLAIHLLKGAVSQDFKQAEAPLKRLVIKQLIRKNRSRAMKK